jgi:aspartyl-tRNA synthetase
MITDFNTIHELKLGSNVHLGGFVHTVRDHGSLIFIDLRNETSFVQCVIDPERNQNFFAIAGQLHNEQVIELEGTIVARSEDRINNDMVNGMLEIEIASLTIVAPSKPLPFDLHATDNVGGEEIRLKYRYLDLRRAKMHKMLVLRHKLILKTRNWFDQRDFVEVTTPILANSSPEGSRDYLVPSRIHEGKFYALPQAPQQFKQLLMVGGFNKYFQIAPCFRDEDPRSDRHPGDFYQLDVEMAWSGQEEVFGLVETYINEVYSNSAFSNKKFDGTFVRLTYDQAMDEYGSDKPDLRFDLHWVDAKEYFVNSGFEVFATMAEKKTARVQALVLKNMVNNFSRAQLDKLQDISRSFGLPGIAYMQYFSEEAKSPLFKFLSEQERANLEQGLGLETGDLVLFLAHENKAIVHKAQNKIRLEVAHKENLIDESALSFAWITDFPFFEQDEKTGAYGFEHNPFSMWQSDPGLTPVETLQKHIKNNTLTELKAIQCDLACNGYEILSGGKRNNIPEAILQAFLAVGYTESDVRQKFTHMLEAYEFGAPYHAGFAMGLERMIMILTDETNIREVIPFPKNGSGIDVMTNSPSSVGDKQLSELSLKLDL